MPVSPRGFYTDQRTDGRLNLTLLGAIILFERYGIQVSMPVAPDFATQRFTPLAPFLQRQHQIQRHQNRLGNERVTPRTPLFRLRSLLVVVRHGRLLFRQRENGLPAVFHTHDDLVFGRGFLPGFIGLIRE